MIDFIFGDLQERLPKGGSRKKSAMRKSACGKRTRTARKAVWTYLQLLSVIGNAGAGDWGNAYENEM